MPTTVGPDDNADGEPEDEGDALAVSGFGNSAPSPFRARAVRGGTRPTQWVTSDSPVGGAHGGVGSGAYDDTVPGFGGGSSEVPGLGRGGGGFGAEQEPGAGSWLIPEVVRMAH